ncbi:hypothetical protein R80B4_00002 [Fibrobacteres bacterium R8-0-B4]
MLSFILANSPWYVHVSLCDKSLLAAALNTLPPSSMMSPCRDSTVLLRALDISSCSSFGSITTLRSPTDIFFMVPTTTFSDSSVFLRAPDISSLSSLGSIFALRSPTDIFFIVPITTFCISSANISTALAITPSSSLRFRLSLTSKCPRPSSFIILTVALSGLAMSPAMYCPTRTAAAHSASMIIITVMTDLAIRLFSCVISVPTNVIPKTLSAAL